MSRLELLVDLATVLAREVDLDAMLGMACERVAEALQADRATVWLIDAEQGDLVTRVALLPEVTQLRQPAGKGIAGHVARTGEVVRLADVRGDDRWDPSADKLTGYRTRSVLAVPIREDRRSPVRGVIQLLNKKQGTFDEADARYLVALGMQLARALSLTTLRASDEAGPGLVLRGPFNHVIGRSASMRAVYERMALAARSDATVLLRGETGTGKGLVARAIHVNSNRQSGPFVTVDCTTLPAQLVESELFGHERGAFTGADRRVPGRVELADGGTLLLDEIGDLPGEMQGKLLRFLQERKFERVGGRTELTTDVRIVCATHRNLEEAVERGTFREDLYYRVRVLEIEIPPLRDRGQEEIRSLAEYFATEHPRRYGRPAAVIDAAAMKLILAHEWPGNVRELEHWIESAVVLSTDGIITPALLPAPKRVSRARNARPEVSLPLGLSLEQATRGYIEATLQACDGNKTRAARSLQVGRNTLARALSPEGKGEQD